MQVMLLEVCRVDDDGTPCVRASVSLADVDIPPLVGSGKVQPQLEPGADWRDYSSSRPRFLDGIPTPRSPKRSARGTPRFKVLSAWDGPGGGGATSSTPTSARSTPHRGAASKGAESKGAESGGAESGAAASSHSVPNSACATPVGASSRAGGGEPARSESAFLHSGAAAHAASRDSSRAPSSFLRSSSSSEGLSTAGLSTGRSGSPLGSSPTKEGTPRLPAQAGVAVGWITVHKGERELVTPRGSLRAGDRQKHMQQWARRIAVDRSLAVMGGPLGGLKRSGGKKESLANEFDASKEKKKIDLSTVRGATTIYSNELSADEKKIGFAFGGVDPGRLHAHGQLFETHKVHYSIAMTGLYRLHVALRQDGVQLPGSPYILNVVAGPASALSTVLPIESLPLQGVVGNGKESGCRVILRALDKMGNTCTAGGAVVVCACPKAEDKVNTRTFDNKVRRGRLSQPPAAPLRFERCCFLTRSVCSEHHPPLTLTLPLLTIDLATPHHTSPHPPHSSHLTSRLHLTPPTPHIYICTPLRTAPMSWSSKG